jgi:hypothetical protein
MPQLYKPDPFLEIRVQEIDGLRGVLGLCAGFESSEWRYKGLAAHLMEWLPEFSLNWSELMSIGPHNMMSRAKQAARNFYTSEKYQSRGEIGELLLHAAIRHAFETVPAVSKMYYKDSANDTVKGFDAVHVVATDSSLELWVGEVKLYKDISDAVYDVSLELTTHLSEAYLRQEFIAINNKIDATWPHAEKLKKLIHRNTSLDEVFDCICIPVLLAYESELFTSHQAASTEFKEAFAKEIIDIRTKFNNKNTSVNIKVQLILFPMKEKKNLLDEFNDILKGMQK